MNSLALTSMVVGLTPGCAGAVTTAQDRFVAGGRTWVVTDCKQIDDHVRAACLGPG
jgi:hypothetical protein